MRRFGNNQIFHIYNRGTRKSRIFRNESDYRRWEEILYWCLKYDYTYSVYLRQVKRAKEANRDPQKIEKKIELTNKIVPPQVAILAFAHMPNHFHLVLKQLVKDGISKFVHRISTAYSMYFNRKYDIKGGLYEGNFKDVLIESNLQFVQVARYVHINPVAAGLVSAEDLVSYPRTSLPNYFRKSNVVGLVETEELLDFFKGDRNALLSFTLSKFKENEKDRLEGKTIDNDLGWY